MIKMLKYLIVAAFCLVLHGAADKDNLLLAVSGDASQAGECTQYHHSVYEPEGEIYAVSSSNSINNTLRLNKKNKRAGAYGKWCPEFTRNPKSTFNGNHSPNIHKSYICNPYLACSAQKLISLGKLII